MEQDKGGIHEERIIDLPKGMRDFDSSLFGATVRKGFSQLYQDKETSDIILLVGEDKIPAHKIVLSSWSDTFRAMLGKSWQEGSEKELRVHVEPEDNEHFKLLLEYMYTGNAEFIDNDNVVPLVILTNYYGVHALKEVCGRLLGAQINAGNVQFLLDLVEKYDCKDLEKACGQFLANNYAQMWRDEHKRILSLRPDTWVAMLHNDSLDAASEQELFENVIEYADQFDKKTREEVLEKLLPGLRYSFISPKYLTEVVEKNQAINTLPILQKILFENYRFKTYSKCTPTTFITRPRTGFQKFADDGKGMGIILSNEGTTASAAMTPGWQSVRVELPFSDTNIYCEFKCDTANNVMIGAVAGSVPMMGYVGQQATGICIHNTDGNMFTAGSTVAKGLFWTTGDSIGVSYIPSTGVISWYKNGTKSCSHNAQKNTQDLYAAVSMMTANAISLVPRPSLPDDLVAYLKKAGKSVPGGERKKKNKPEGPTSPPPPTGPQNPFGVPMGMGGFGGMMIPPGLGMGIPMMPAGGMFNPASPDDAGDDDY